MKWGLKMKCFHHTDHDGHASGAIVKYANPECVLFPLDYDSVFPMSKMVPGETVVMVDVSLKLADMQKLSKICQLIYIDHHKSSIEEIRKANLVLDGLVDYEEVRAACELTWMYYFPELDLPVAISLLGQYDTFDLSEECLNFEYGLRSIDTDPSKNMQFWKDLFESGNNNNPFDNTLIEDISEDGVIIRKYLELFNKQYIQPKMFLVEFEGLRFLTINHPRTDSTVFDGIFNKTDYDAMMVFRRIKDCWSVSLYGAENNSHDLSIIAKKYGGGGHAGSCGFKVKRLPFEI